MIAFVPSTVMFALTVPTAVSPVAVTHEHLTFHVPAGFVPAAMAASVAAPGGATGVRVRAPPSTLTFRATVVPVLVVVSVVGA